MKKFILHLHLIIIFSLFSFSSFSKKIIDAKDVELRQDNLVYEISTKKPFTGIVKDYLQNGEPKAEISYKDGLLDGMFQGYILDGEKSLRIATFKKGKLDGSLKFFTDNYLSEEYLFDDNTLNKIAYILNNSENQDDIDFTEVFGTSYARKEYYPSGKMKRIVHFKNDLPNGAIITYYEDGHIETEETCVDGLLEGVQNTYYENGALYTIQNFSKGKKNGEYIIYSEDGKLNLKGNFTDDKLNGEFIEYNLDGGISNRAIYKNGELIQGSEVVLSKYFSENTNDSDDTINHTKIEDEDFSSYIFLAGLVIFFIFSFCYLNSRVPNLGRVSEVEAKKIFNIFMEHSRSNKDLLSPSNLLSSSNLYGLGTRFYKITHLNVNGVNLNIRVKIFSLLFLPTPLILGYLLCDGDEALFTFTNDDFKRAVTEIKEYLQKI